MYEKNENINKDKDIIKGTTRNYEAEKGNNWKEKFTGGT